jgi:DNA invertase Pin-like site-specific DNA recombinase
VLAIRGLPPLDSNRVFYGAIAVNRRSQPSPAVAGSPAAFRAVIYARVSSAAQRDRHTIASQLSTLPTFVEARGWRLVQPPETYVDDGRTAKGGFLAKRQAFNRLIQDANLGLFDVVVVIDLDRLTRSEDLQERGEVLGAFQRAGVQLAVSSTGQILDLRSSVGDLMSSLGTFFAAEANRKHRERIMRGKDEAIRKGKKPAGPTPFGYVYDREAGTWGVDPELGAIVLEIFERVSEGETCESIARDLQARGVQRARPSKSGRRAPGVWIRERVHQIVRSRTYLGRWFADKNRALAVPVPRIIDQGLYARADAALLRAGHRGQLRNPHQYLLQGISVCGLCGSRIGCSSTGSWLTGKGAPRSFYYVCSRRRRPKPSQKPCGLPMFRSDAIDQRLWDAIVDSVIRQDHLERAIAESSQHVKPDRSAKSLHRLEARLEKLVRAEEVLLDRFGRGFITESLLDKSLTRLSQERAAATESISSERAATGGRRPAPDASNALKQAVEALRREVRIATPKDRRDIVRAIVGRQENAVKIGSNGIQARICLASLASPAVAQVHIAG